MRCEKCKIGELMQGPHTNLLCNNIHCRARWNEEPLDLVFVGFDEHPEKIRKREADLCLKKHEMFLNMRALGVEAFKKNAAIWNLEIPEGKYPAVHKGDLLWQMRFGWMQALADKVNRNVGEGTSPEEHDRIINEIGGSAGGETQ